MRISPIILGNSSAIWRNGDFMEGRKGDLFFYMAMPRNSLTGLAMGSVTD